MSVVKREIFGPGEPPSTDTSRPGAPAARPAAPEHRKLGPVVLTYLMGPTALVILLLLRSVGAVSRQPVWIWVGLFVAIPIVSIMVDRRFERRPSSFTLHLRVAANAAAVTSVIYLTGWGPVLTTAYIIIGIENIFRSGSRVWKVSLFWSLVGISIGQILVLQGLAPSFLSTAQALTLGSLGTVLMVFMVRLTGATSEQKEMAESSVRTSEERFRSLVQNSSDTTLVLGTGGVVAYASPAIASLLGREPETVVGTRALDLAHPEDRQRVELELTTRLANNPLTDPIQFRMATTDRSWRHVEAVVTDLRDRPAVAGYVANVRDITERKEAESLLAHQALHDPLTGLPNRLLLVDRLQQALARSRRQRRSAPTVMFLDLDRFKLVNDSLGHGAGDQLLIQVAKRLEEILRSTDTVSRFGGDEFVMVCENITDENTAVVLAEEVKRALEEPYTINGGTVSVGVSIGVTFVDEDCASVDELLSEADFAMYLAKSRSETGRVQLFDRAARTTARQRVDTETSLARALERGELRVFYQPIVDVRTRRRVGVEALVRWQHPTRGLLAPNTFLEVAEQTGLIVPIGAWVLGEACEQVARWNANLAPEDQISVSVNLSARQLAEPDLAQRVSDTLSQARVDPRSVRLYLEITETLLPTDHEGARRHLFDLRQLGIDLAIDDFGTGYSSLRYVRDLPISIVKIDRSFVSGLGRSRQDEAIVRAVAELAHTLGLQVIAEGVETELQLAKLAGYPCDFAQGFLFGRPQPANAFTPSAPQAAEETDEHAGSPSLMQP
ncbi:MAG TPA: bifunctional diguanylate cyclase/phosphodiesterase [Acidimicrobiales bacterium]|nr:bifunctional diguanylate cyclase/phosphodiesterase [Acidimicrobiales bacterium]